MRTISLLAWVGALALLAACTTTTNNSTLGSHPIASGDDDDGANVGKDDSDGEHGSNAPAGGDKAAPTGGTTLQSDTWSGTKSITDNVTIAAGQTITISPGTTVTVSGTAAITIKGTLKVDAASNHVKMTGTTWQGLIVASGGTLTADGLDITGATDGIWTQAGDTDATFKDGSVSAGSPFKMEAGSKLTFDHSSATATSAGSAIAGNFVATFMTYDKQTNGGLTLNDAAGSMSITDSTLKGAGGGDYVISQLGQALSVKYTTITGSHCGFHFDSVSTFTIDHVSVQGNSYGAMLYGSGAGPNTITATNFRDNNTTDIDLEGTNGAIAMDGSFITTVPKGITTSNPAAAAVADAQPRADTTGQ